MKSRTRLIIITVLAVLALANHVVEAEKANEDGKKIPFTIREITGSIKIDGKLNDKAWQHATKFDLNYEVEPGENITPPVKTECYLTYNQTYLYVAFRCLEPEPDKIRARVSDRDHDYGDDFVGVMLDTFNDERKNYAIWCNPRGVQEDAIRDKDLYDKSWDARYLSVGKIDTWGYGIEMAIPFSSLRFQRSKEAQIWGFDAWRLLPRNVLHIIAAAPLDRNISSYQAQMIKIKGFAGIKPGRNLEFVPTVTAIRTDGRTDFPHGDLTKMDESAEFGLTARWGVTNNLTLGGTINPDFSQVEADAQQLNVNQPFALFFEEKRPFFTEGAEYFNTPMTAVYTRTLRDPAWGLKLTGKEGKHSIGAYVVKDELTNLIFPGSQGSDATSLQVKSMATVLRYKFDLGSNYTIGGLFTNRSALKGSDNNGNSFNDYSNSVYGIDGVLRFTKKDRLDVQLLGSTTRYPDQLALAFGQPGGSFSDKAIKVKLRHESRNFFANAYYDDLGDDFRADLGFIPQVGYRRVKGGLFYRWLGKPGSWWNLFQIGGLAYQYNEQKGRGLLLRGAATELYFEGALMSYGTLTIYREREAFNGREFDLTYGELYYSCRPIAPLQIVIDSTLGDRVDYDNSRAGKRFQFTPEVSWFVGNHLRLTFSHTYEQMRVESKKLYTANISQGTLVYQFTTRMFFRSILQYVNYRYNMGNYIVPVEPEFKHLFMQLLFSYKLNPQTVVFLGYTDNWLGNRNVSLTRSERTFFLKVGYAFNF